MKILIANDHAAVELKNSVILFLKNKGLDVEDFGVNTSESVDFPDYADKVCENISSSDKQTFGILICGSGQGMAMRANKYPHIRAALVYSDDIAKLSREHNDANIICIGSRFSTSEQTLHWIDIFLNTKFSEGRHSARVAKINKNPSYC